MTPPARPRTGSARTSPAILVATLALAVVALAACGPSGASSASGRLDVVATTTVFRDLVQRVGGDRVTVTSLVPKGGEVHTYDPRPSDVAAVASARVIFANGLGLDGWLENLARDAGTGAAIVGLGEHLDGVTYLGGSEAGGVNPHLWMDPSLAVRYVDRIRDSLVAADPAGRATYEANAATVETDLNGLDAWARGRFETVPPAARRLVSLHDAFPYFARAYGLEVVGVVVSVPGQDPSAGEVAALISAIRSAGVRAILSEVQFPSALADRIAEETGAKVVSDLYTDSLGDPPTDTYDALIRWDVDRIVEALSR